MTTINLIPRKPWLEQNAQKIIVFIILLIVISIVLQVIINRNLLSENVQLDEETELLDRQIAIQNEKRIPDTLTTRIATLASEVDKLEAERKEWLPVFANILGTLPEETTILNMGIVSERVLSAEYKFYDFDALIQYVQDVQSSALFKSVTLSKLTFVDPNEKLEDLPLNSDPIFPIINVEPIVLPDEESKLREELNELLLRQGSSINMGQLDINSPFFGESSPFNYQDIERIIDSNREIVNFDSIIEEIEADPYIDPFIQLTLTIQL